MRRRIRQGDKSADGPIGRGRVRSASEDQEEGEHAERKK